MNIYLQVVNPTRYGDGQTAVWHDDAAGCETPGVPPGMPGAEPMRFEVSGSSGHFAVAWYDGSGGWAMSDGSLPVEPEEGAIYLWDMDTGTVSIQAQEQQSEANVQDWIRKHPWESLLLALVAWAAISPKTRRRRR